MTEVQVNIDEKELDSIIRWFRNQPFNDGIDVVDIDTILNIVLMKTCMKNAIPFHVKVQHVGGD